MYARACVCVYALLKLALSLSYTVIVSMKM